MISGDKLSHSDIGLPGTADGDRPIADYALIGNLHTAALISRAGSIDWFCPGRFDSPACFAALLGKPEHGYWRLAPRADTVRDVQREYLDTTLLLRTVFTTDAGTLEVIDYMPVGCGCHMVREVRVLSGSVHVECDLLPRFGYGRHTAEVSTLSHPEAPSQLIEVLNELTEVLNELTEVPNQRIEVPIELILQHQQDRLRLATDAPVAATKAGGARGQFELRQGQHRYFLLTSDADGGDIAPHLDMATSAINCAGWWRAWAAKCTYQGPLKNTVVRSLIVLKAMTYAPTGAIVAAPTTSLPEVPGGSANWDYRFTWPRDAALVLDVLLRCGYQDEALAWRNWLLQAVSGTEGALKTLYTIDGAVSSDEAVLDWLPGYQGSRPVRVGNQADHQFQLDLRGEIIEMLHLARKTGIEFDNEMWDLQCQILEYVEQEWQDPDAGIWESRQPPQHYTHSKVFAWAAFDRSIHDAEAYGLDAPLERWRQVRDEIKAAVLAKALHSNQRYFVRFYGDDQVDAALLMIPLLGFLPPDDPRIVATVAEIEEHFCSPEGFVYRNPLAPHAGKEGAFLLCTCWLADYHMIAGHNEHAKQLLENLLNICNDVGLLAEEYDPHQKKFLGNFPQSFSHLSLVKSALLIGAHQKVEFSGDGDN